MRIIKTFESFKLNEKATIDLSGPDGNAMALVGHARSLGKQLDLDYKSIQTEMMSGDYENLLSVFNKYFGQVVELTGRDIDEEEFESVKESARTMWESLLPEQIKWIRNEVLPIDDLDEAMMELQEVIVQTDDGGICGVYFSKYDDSNEHWASSTEEERMEDVKGYLELEESYDKLNDTNESLSDPNFIEGFLLLKIVSDVVKDIVVSKKVHIDEIPQYLMEKHKRIALNIIRGVNRLGFHIDVDYIEKNIDKIIKRVTKSIYREDKFGTDYK